MGKRGPKPKAIVDITWSPNFAYAIGLLATDGSLSNDGRHISFVSKDKEQADNYAFCLGLNQKISQITSRIGTQAYKIQFGSVLFYNFLLSIGLTPAKSLTISCLKIPNEYFFDFYEDVSMAMVVFMRTKTNDGDLAIHSV